MDVLSLRHPLSERLHIGGMIGSYTAIIIVVWGTPKKPVCKFTDKKSRGENGTGFKGGVDPYGFVEAPANLPSCQSPSSTLPSGYVILPVPSALPFLTPPTYFRPSGQVYVP